MTRAIWPLWVAVSLALYRLTMWGYGGLLALAAGLGVAKARRWWRMRAGGRQALAEATAALPPDAAWSWFHCASLGEYEQARPVIEAYRAMRPEDPILLTFFSPSGFEPLADRRPAWWLPGDHLAASPWDVYPVVQRWLGALGGSRPRLRFLALSKYEVWPDQIRHLQRAGIPTAVFAAYHPPGAWPLRRLSGVVHDAWRGLTTLLVQDEQTAGLWRDCGVPALAVGDPRADRVAAIAASDSPTDAEWMRVVQWVAGRRCLVAGSTWEPEEQALMQVGWPPGGGRCWICVPHETDEDHIRSLTDALGRAGLRWVTWSALTAAAPADPAMSDPEVLVVDRVGRLAQLYRLGQVAVVGGGFGKGVHNTLEPAAHGLYVLTGPHIARFREAQALVACGGLRVANRPEDLTSLARQAMDDPASAASAGRQAQNWVQANTGAAPAIASHLARLTSSPPPALRR